MDYSTLLNRIEGYIFPRFDLLYSPVYNSNSLNKPLFLKESSFLDLAYIFKKGKNGTNFRKEKCLNKKYNKKEKVDVFLSEMITGIKRKARKALDHIIFSQNP